MESNMHLVGVGYSLEMFAKYAPNKWCSCGVVLLIEGAVVV